MGPLPLFLVISVIADICEPAKIVNQVIRKSNVHSKKEAPATTTTAVPVDGVWSAWSSGSTCSRSCGGGSRQSTRQCDNPAPSNGGRQCQGQGAKTYTCNNQACPVMCKQGCINGECTGPNQCICKTGWTGADCGQFDSARACKESCINGHCTAYNKCNCEPGWTGASCDVWRNVKGCPFKPGETSWIIAFDTSGSMSIEMTALKVGVQKIATDLNNNADMSVRDYVLIEFGEASVEMLPKTLVHTKAKFLVHTTDVEEFKSKVNGLSLHGGDEWSMKAIQIAVKYSQRNSYIYVFTDEPIRDPQRYNATLKIVKEVNMHVVFLLSTSGLQSASQTIKKPFHDMARETGGAVMMVNENDLSPVYKFIGTTFHINRNILMKTTTFSNDKDLPVIIDKTLSNFMVTVEGEIIARSNIKVTNPNGGSVPLLDEHIIFEYSGSIMFKISSPAAGSWSIRITSSAEFEVGVTAESIWHLEYGFSPKNTIKDICDTYRNPLKRADLNGYLFLKLAGDYQGIQDLTHIELTYVNAPATPLKISLHATALHPGVYDSNVNPKKDQFDVKVYGVDKSGNAVVRAFESPFHAAPE